MLIRWATENDISTWQALTAEMTADFKSPAVNNYEVLTAVDYMSGKCMGFISFSRERNRIVWFGVAEKHNGKGVEDKLLKTALRQLDTDREVIGVNGEVIRAVTNEKRGHSFHYRYPEFIREAQREFCPCCNGEPSPEGQNPIEVNDRVWIVAEYPGQGRLFGKMYVMPVKHAFQFEDMAEAEAAEFMSEVRRVGRALRKVTGAVKINYEMHSNTGAHLHIHLFPRYLDDDFPGMAIDVRQREPAPYESYEEYLWFIEQMRKTLKEN